MNEIPEMKLTIGIDDTDNLTSRGTGNLARTIAAELSKQFQLIGVTRHQLLVDERVPYTSHNSSAAIQLVTDAEVSADVVFAQVAEMMRVNFQPDSDPGLCVAVGDVPEKATAFGRRAQSLVVSQLEARELAADHSLHLAGLGGTEDGVIGALAAVGLAASGDDGRFLLVGRIREISGLIPVEEVLACGVHAVRLLDDTPVEQGYILADKLRPACRGGKPIQYVDWAGEFWQPLKL
jgi:hypothetical protein